MNNFTKIISNMEEKIKNKKKKISKGIDTKKKRNFILDMIYGLIASSSCYISDIARSLNEDITLKALEKRLSRNLEEFNNGKKENKSTYEDIRNKIIFENYENEIVDKIDENTVFCFDPGDLTKNFTTKFEAIDTIKKGITRTAYTGYMKITIPSVENKTFYLVVIKRKRKKNKRYAIKFILEIENRIDTHKLM